MITSTSNAQIKNMINLMGKAKARREQQAYVAEGIRMFLEIPEDRIKAVYLAKDSQAAGDPRVRERLKETGVECETVSEAVFRSISGTVTPQGILSVVKMQSYVLQELLGQSSGEDLFLVLEDLQDPGNLGTIMRTAEAAGVKAVVMSKGTVDIYNPKVIRSTMGAVFRLPFVYVENLLSALEEMKKNGICIVAAHLGGSVWYDEINYRKNTAFCIGNEGNGLSEALAGAADIKIRIPMEGKAESLNAAVAASVLLYEAYRQKRKK